MYRLKDGYPEENEMVLCTVTNVQHHSVFARLDEYNNKTGLIHISEVSPGRIRNLRDFVKEGKVIVCKILRVNLEKGHIDLSLRRVSEAQRKQKVSEIKQEQRAEKIIDVAAKKLKKDSEKIYRQILDKLPGNYPSLYSYFEAVVEEGASFEKLGLEKDIAKELESIIRARIKPAEVIIGGELSVSSYAPDGVDILKKALKAAFEGKDNLKIKYVGRGNYNIEVKANDYKDAEKTLKESIDSVTKLMQKQKDSSVSFTREKKS